MAFNQCLKCNRPAHPDSHYCEICEDIAIERSEINKDWLHFEGHSAPENELPQYPKKEGQ